MDRDQAIARHNIEHFRKLLANETEQAKRQTLLRLLAEEKARLAAAESRAREKKAGKAR
ncbi:MAG TPA: hypothetical protein VK877_03880 [Pseudolabrys sp.]|nr:hypothetical protein [Pseudolabrys sp.]